jgi:CRP-like cAMP-binding protein
LELIEILKKAKLFKGLREKELQAVAELGVLRTCSKGETIFSENAEGNNFFFVVNGAIAINKNVAGGRKRNLSNLKKGDIFGELALFDSQPRSADAEVIEDSEIVEFSIAKFRNLLKKNLVISFIIQTRIIRILCRRLRDTDEMLKEGVIWGFKMDV